MKEDFSKGMNLDIPPKPPVGGEYKDALNAYNVYARFEHGTYGPITWFEDGAGKIPLSEERCNKIGIRVEGNTLRNLSRNSITVHAIDTVKVAQITVKESHPKWRERLDYDPSQHTVVNGITIPMGHYWQSGKIRPVMKKQKTKKRGK